MPVIAFVAEYKVETVKISNMPEATIRMNEIVGSQL